MARREMSDHFPWEYHLYIDLLPNGGFLPQDEMTEGI